MARVIEMWKAFARKEWETIFDIIEFEESCYWAGYLSYLNLTDNRLIINKKWIDHITSGKLDKSVTRDLIKAVELQECMDLLKAIKVKRWILDKP